jgi:hypothetical protein
MATSTNLGSRRNAAQLHALAGVEREVRAQDPSGRRKYLRDFSQAFRTYDAILERDELTSMIKAADIVLVGDYHALPTSQRFAASLLEERAHPGDRPVVLGVETIFSRDQHVLDEWWRREIDAEELRQRIRFEADWGYDWTPFYELLVTAREHAEAIYGLDCMPREDLRKIGARDRHAADKIAEIRLRHPHAAIFVLFGESHLAPSHLPRSLRERLPEQRSVTVLQNVDALYWQATSQRHDPVEAVRVSDNVVCIFNSTPLEKYESYRLHLSRWSSGEEDGPDLAPTIYNLIESLIRFLGINLYASSNGTQPKFLVDRLPEVYGAAAAARLCRQLLRRGLEREEWERIMEQAVSRGSVYVPAVNAFYVHEFQMVYAAEETARFLHYVCRGGSFRSGLSVSSLERKDRFYAQTLEHALAYLGSRVLYPARLAVSAESEGYSLSVCRKLVREAVRSDKNRFDATTQQLGYTLGSELYDLYLKGCLSQRALRRLFLAHIEEPGTALENCKEILRKIVSSRKKPCGSVS